MCDGNNSTPDLRDRFVIGASAGTGDTSYPGLSPGAQGGSADATLVSHQHSAGTYSASSAGAHTHSYDHNQSQTSLDNDEGNATIYPNQTSDTTGSAGAHTHSVSGTSGSAGSSATNANLPPYYALCYIMKS